MINDFQNNSSSPVISEQTAYNQQLQEYLRALSYEYSDIPKIVIDGVIGPETVEALKAFQQLVGLDPTGVADPLTWELLNKQYRLTLKKNKDPVSFESFYDSELIFQSGDSHPSIFAIQQAFELLSQVYTNFIFSDYTGTVDSITASNIREFRRIALLPDGTHLDIDLWNILAITHNSLN